MTRPFDLSPDQRAAFDRTGLLRLAGFYPPAAAAAMADRVWEDLERRFGRLRDRPDTWTGPAPGKFQALKRSGAFAPLGSPELFALADALMGAGCWDAPARWGGLLLTFPSATPPERRPAWHLDIFGDQPLTPLPILRIFTFLEPVPPGGGGTLCIAGSHRLALAMEQATGGPIRSETACRALRSRHDWFARMLEAPHAALVPEIGIDAEVAGEVIRLEEMTGAPGDLVVMHPGLVHGGTHNRSDRPRIMLTEWLMRRDAQAPPAATPAPE